MTLVRTTKQPDRVLDVDAAELLDLTRMGLILEVVPPESAAPSTPTTTSTPSTPATPPPLPSPSAATSTSTDGKGK